MSFRNQDETDTGAGTLVRGDKTPADSYANPTDALDTWSLGAVWNGTTWDRVRAASVFQAATTQVGLQGVAPIGIQNTTLPTLTNGQQSQAQMDTRGGLLAVLKDVNGTVQATVLSVSADGQSTGGQGNGLTVGSVPKLWNEATYDRERGNTQGTVLASAARTASVDSADLTNYNARGVHVIIDATAITATPSITATIQGKDTLSGKYYTILASAAITGVSTTILRVYPGITTAANLAAADVLPRTWRVSVVAGDADSITYSIGYSLIV